MPKCENCQCETPKRKTYRSGRVEKKVCPTCLETLYAQDYFDLSAFILKTEQALKNYYQKK